MLKASKVLFYSFLCLFMSLPLLAKGNLERDLPSVDFTLVETNSKVKKPSFERSKSGSTIRLFSNLSRTWTSGLSFDTTSLAASIPMVGSAEASVKDSQYTWNFADSGSSFSKKGNLTIEQSPDGCPKRWNFLVKVQGKNLRDDTGSIRYSCSSGKLNPVVQETRPMSSTHAEQPSTPKALKIADLLPKST